METGINMDKLVSSCVPNVRERAPKQTINNLGHDAFVHTSGSMELTSDDVQGYLRAERLQVKQYENFTMDARRV